MNKMWWVTSLCVVAACKGKPDAPDTNAAAGSPRAVEPAFPFGAKDDTLGKAISDVMAYSFTVPETGDDASRLAQAAETAKATLAADPAAAEARVLPPCKAAAVSDGPLQFVCMDLLGAFDTPATLSWLGEVAQTRLVLPEPADDEQITEGEASNPQVFQVHRALVALGQRGLAGGDTARDALVDAAVGSDPHIQAFAVGVALDALPRAAVRQALLKRLDPSLHHLVYAHP